MTMISDKIVKSPKEPDEHALNCRLNQNGFGLNGFVSVSRLHVLIGFAAAFAVGLTMGAYLVGYILSKFGTR